MLGIRKLKGAGYDESSTRPLLSGSVDSDSIGYGTIPCGTVVRSDSRGSETLELDPKIECLVDEVGLRMIRGFSLSHILILMLGNIIGSGIFIGPNVVASGGLSVAMTLSIWGFAGIYNVLIALGYMELGCMFQETGAEYNFFRLSLGTAPAFIYAWTTLMITTPANSALLTITTYDYLFKSLMELHDVHTAARILFCIWLLVLIIVVNSTYTKYVTKFQTFFTVAKILGMLLIIVIGIVQLAAGKTEILATGFQNTNTDPSAYANAMYAGLFTYGGWQFVFIIMEEVQNPEKVAPQATIISMLSVTLLYTFTNVAYFTVLTPQEMMASSAVAVTFAEKTIGKYSAVIPILVACSTIGALNGSIMGASRVYFAAARDNLFPCIFSAINIKYYTPWPSLIITGLATIIYILTGSAVTLIEYVGFIGMITFGLTSFCTVYLRFKDPHRHRPFKAPIVLSILVVLVNGGLIVLGLYNSPKQYGIGLLLILSGVPVYLFIQYCHNKPKALIRFHHSFTAFVEKVLLVFPSDK